MKNMLKQLEKKILATLSGATGSVSAIFGTIGILGWCCAPAVTTFFGLFGVSSIFLMKYNLIFLIIGIVMVNISILLYMKNRRCKKNTA